MDINLAWLIFMAFIGGLLSGLTPCLLPLLPVTMLMIGVKPRESSRRNFTLSAAMASGMAFAYSLLGLTAGLMGKGLSFLFQSRLFLVIVAFVFFMMSLSLFGVYTLRPPKWVTDALARIGGASHRGAFLTGISMSVFATPCTGPVLGAFTVYGVSLGKLTASFILFFAYGLGLGVLIVVIGTAYGSVVSRLKKVNVLWIKRFIGLLLLAVALYYLNGLMPYSRLISGGTGEVIKWQTPSALLSPLSAMRDGASDKRPYMVYFTAKWCPPCMIFKTFTLKDKNVVALSKKFNNIKVDMTFATREEEQLAVKYNVRGWPAVIFISPDGGVFDDLTFFGYVSAGELYKHMKKALERAGVRDVEEGIDKL